MYLSESIRERNMFPLPFGENTPSDVELARFAAPGGLGELDRTLT
jgi:hypothetical protein